jgi:DNA replication protein DnaC
MSREVVVADLVKTEARSLKMPGLGRSFESLARQARSESWSFEEYLHEVLSAEIASRTQSAIRSRLKAARFPEHKTLDEFDFAAADAVEPGLLADLARGGWIERGDNVLLAGPIGTGKTHLAIALGVEAARQKRRVAFHRAADLVRMLHEARDERQLGLRVSRIVNTWIAPS